MNYKTCFILLIATFLQASMLACRSSSDNSEPVKKVVAEKTKQKLPTCEYGDLDECERLCEEGSGDSCSNLGIMYVNGIGVDRDEKQAAILYKKACDMDSADGCYALYSAHLYDVGLRGDPEIEKFALNKACKLGHKKSCSISGIRSDLGVN